MSDTNRCDAHDCDGEHLTNRQMALKARVAELAGELQLVVREAKDSGLDQRMLLSIVLSTGAIAGKDTPEMKYTKWGVDEAQTVRAFYESQPANEEAGKFTPPATWAARLDELTADEMAGGRLPAGTANVEVVG